MALAIILRKTLNVQGAQNILKSTIKIDSIRPFAQILNGIQKEPKKISNAVVFSCPKRSMSGDHGKLWTIERVASLALLGIVPLAIITPNTLLDDALATTMVLHFHWGLEACAVDYVRPIIVGPALPKIALALLYLISVSTLGGLLYYNHTSIGIGNTVRKVWKN